ncbi:precorrin-6y C5,15-methyltransferase (decarboxylating) subunit CbiE [Chloroflexota bacterium]
MPEGKIYIIGVAPDGVSALSPRACELINGAEIIMGSRRLLAMFPALTGEKIAIRNNLAEVTDSIKRNLEDKRMVVLASGDPSFYGIAGYLTGKLGKDVVDIIPNVSSMQVAFARIKESWEDAALVSVHSRPIEDIVETVRSNHKVGIFTDDEHTPAAIARVLLEHGIDGRRAYVCQNLGSRDEKVVAADLRGLGEMEFSPLNVLILLRDPEKPAGALSPRYLGVPDEEFHQRRPKEGLITKQEVRAVSLAKMRLTENSVVWDIGAGSGAISVEASYLAGKGRVYAVEKNDADVAIIKKNISKFKVPNVEVVQAFAPDGLSQLPDPTAVFIGGSGGVMEGILDLVCRRLKPGGRIVMNIVALENLGVAVNALKARGFIFDVTLVSVARSTDIMELTRFEALNPVFVVATGKKGGALPHD